MELPFESSENYNRLFIPDFLLRNIIIIHYLVEYIFTQLFHQVSPADGIPKYTVPRAGLKGYNHRTEFNKKIYIMGAGDAMKDGKVGNILQYMYLQTLELRSFLNTGLSVEALPEQILIAFPFGYFSCKEENDI